MDASIISLLINEKVTEINKLSDNIISFNREGFNFAIVTDADDYFIVRLVIPNFMDLENLNFDTVSLAYKTTINVKSAKVIIVKNKAWATIEAFHKNEESFVSVFDNCVSSLIASVYYFRMEAKKKSNNKEMNGNIYVQKPTKFGWRPYWIDCWNMHNNLWFIKKQCAS
jgi:hypothetical protein